MPAEMWAGSSDVEFRIGYVKTTRTMASRISVPTAKPRHGMPGCLNPPSMDAEYQKDA